jgi:predicted Fe-Mo cluster-binding NifX family protein
MKLAIPTRGNNVDSHFGHCEFYTIFTVNPDYKVEKVEILPSPQGCGCKSNIAAILQGKGVSVMLAGNMGDGAVNVLQNHGMEVYRGCSGDVRLVAEAFINGDIKDSGISCSQHEAHGAGHVCEH